MILSLETEGLHFGFLVNVVLAWVAQAVLKTARFSRQSPDEALAGWEGLGGTVENFVLEG